MNDLPAKIDPGSVSLYADDSALYHFSRDSAELKESASSQIVLHRTSGACSQRAVCDVKQDFTQFDRDSKMQA